MKRLKSIIVAALAVLIATVYAVPAPSASAASSSLSIAPKKTYEIEPGKTVNDTLVIRNIDTVNDLQLTMRVIDFTYNGDDGTPKLMIDPNEPLTTWSLRSFLSVPQTVEIPAGGSKSVDMSVSMPANLGAGSYYSAILYSTGAPDGGNVGLSASGATLVFVTVPGEVNEKLTLTKFGAYLENGAKKNYATVMATMPYKLAYTVKNEGNVFESPVGSIKLRDIFGREQVINNVNPTSSLALIGQERTFTACIKLESKDVNFQGSATKTNTCANPGLWPGPYTATLDIFYGQNGNLTQEITKTTIFWYLPWWFVITALIVLAVAAFFIWRLVNKIRAALYGPRGPKRARRR